MKGGSMKLDDCTIYLIFGVFSAILSCYCESETAIHYARILFGVTMGFIFLVHLLMMLATIASVNVGSVNPPAYELRPNPLMQITYFFFPYQLDHTPTQIAITSYDLMKILESMKKMGIFIFISIGMHVYLENIFSLILTTLSFAYHFFTSPMIYIMLYSYDPAKDRPWTPVMYNWKTFLKDLRMEIRKLKEHGITCCNEVKVHKKHSNRNGRTSS